MTLNEIRMDSPSPLGYVFRPVATFGENLRRLRERAGFEKAKDLAAALDVVPSMISKLENDNQGLPEGPTLLRIAKAIKCSLEELFEGVDSEYDSMIQAKKTQTVGQLLTDTTAQQEQNPAFPTEKAAVDDRALSAVDLAKRIQRDIEQLIEEQTKSPKPMDGRH